MSNDFPNPNNRKMALADLDSSRNAPIDRQLRFRGTVLSSNLFALAYVGLPPVKHGVEEPVEDRWFEFAKEESFPPASRV